MRRGHIGSSCSALSRELQGPFLVDVLAILKSQVCNGMAYVYLI